MPLLIVALSCMLLLLMVARFAAANDLLTVGAGLAGQASIFFEAINATSMMDSLQDDGPYTIFAPSDEASQNYSWPANDTELVGKAAEKGKCL